MILLVLERATCVAASSQETFADGRPPKLLPSQHRADRPLNTGNGGLARGDALDRPAILRQEIRESGKSCAQPRRRKICRGRAFWIRRKARHLRVQPRL